MEFRLYFTDADDAFAAMHRVKRIGEPIETLDDVRTDLVDFLDQRAPGLDRLEVAREYQARVVAYGVTVTWPVADDGMDGYELVLEADSIEHVQAVVGIDLDYTWEGEYIADEEGSA